MNERYSTKLPWLLSGVVFAIALAPYLQTARFELLNYDDPIYLDPPSRVAEGLNASSLRWAMTTFLFNWHPLTWISLMLDYSLFGGKPGAMHVHSALLHALNASLLFVLLRKLTGRPWPALAAAGVFAAHPLRVEAVVWIAARKDVLNALFWMLSMLAYVEFAHRKDSQRRYRLAAIATALAMSLGMMAKGMIVSLPLVLLLMDIWPLRRCDVDALIWFQPAEVRRFIRLVIEKIPLFIIAIAGVVVTAVGQARAEAIVDAGDISWNWRIVNAVLSYATYLRQTLWPVNLAIFYPHPAVLGHPIPWIKVALAGALLLIITLGAVVQRGKRPWLLVGWLWFLVTLVPVIGLVQIGSHAHADRYTYIPSIGLIVAIVWTVDESIRRKDLPAWIPATCCAACVVMLSIVTDRAASYWRNSETLFARASEVTSGNYVAHNQLGLALIDRNLLKPAAQEFAIAVDTYPAYATGHNNLAIALQRMGDLPGALEQYDIALQYDPNYVDAMINLGTLLFTAHRNAEAVPYFAKVAEKRPQDASARYDFGVALGTIGRIDAAIEQFEAALSLRSEYPEASSALQQARAIRDNSRKKSPAGIIPATTRASTSLATMPTTGESKP